MPVRLTSRQVRTARWLLDQEEPRSTVDIARELRLSPRVVRSGLDSIDRFLRDYALTLERRRGVGVWVGGSDADRATAKAALRTAGQETAVKVFSARDRLHVSLFQLLTTAPDAQTVEQIQRALHVSMTSARRDVANAEKWLGARGLVLARRPGLGISAVGTEIAIRRAMVKLLLETVPTDILLESALDEDWWDSPEISAGIRGFLSELPLRACHQIVQDHDSLGDYVRSGNPWLAADLAVSAFRIRSGRTVELEPGIVRSLADHPVWEPASAVALALAAVAGGPLPEPEVAGIAEHLLGLAQLIEPSEEQSDVEDRLVERALGVAADRLHPGLADDTALAAGLSNHISRLRIRLRYGLPVHNPLLGEVSARYPEVHAVAREIADLAGEELSAHISEDEAGFVTMYLSGALERLRLRPRRRAVVVCPSGLATVWILVSRIQAEFPELDLVEVLSAGSLSGHEDVAADIVISTVDLDTSGLDVPVLVVNPLLPTEDVRRVARALY